MADLKISELAERLTLADTDEVAVEAGGTTYKTNWANLKSLLETELKTIVDDDGATMSVTTADGITYTVALNDNIATHFDSADSYKLKGTGIKDNAIETDHLQNDAVTNEKLADDSVSSSNLQAGVFTEEKIAALAVTAAKIASSAVTESKIGTGAVTTDKLGDNAVTTVKVADAQITQAKLTQALIDYIDAAGGGTITNNPDDVTLETNGSSQIQIKLPYQTQSRQGTVIESSVGDTRGANSSDFQFSRTADDQVAGAANSFIGGGQNNKIENDTKCARSSIIGGLNNLIHYDDQRGQNATDNHAEGRDNTLSSWYGHAEGIKCFVDGKISHAEGNTCIASGNDGHAEGNRTAIGRKYFELTVHGVDAGLGSNKAYVIIPDAEGDVSSYFPFAGITNVTTRYGAGAQADTKGNIYASGYTPAVWSGDTPTTLNGLTWALHPFCIIRGSAETDIQLIRILSAVYTAGVGTKVYYDSATEIFADTIGIYTSYSPVVAIDGGATGGNGQHSEGRRNSAWGYASHVEGEQTRAWHNYAHAEGQLTRATGQSSHSEGESTIASGVGSHSEGQGTLASGPYSHSEGVDTIASGDRSHAEGQSNTASGDNSHAEGYDNTSSGAQSHTEGESNTASGSGSHAEGNNNEASGVYSHAEGAGNVASGNGSHAEGTNNTASGNYSHARGNGNTAAGVQSSASGQESKALRKNEEAYSHAKFSVVGDGQACKLTASITKTGAGWHEFPIMEYIDSTTYTGLQPNTTYVATTLLAGRQTSSSPGKAGESCGYKIDWGFETRDEHTIGSVDTGADTLDVGVSIPNGTLMSYKTTGTVIGGLVQTSLLYVVNTSGTTIQLSYTAGGAAIDLTSAGTGTHTLLEIKSLGVNRTLIGRTFVDDGDTVGDGETTGIRANMLETSLKGRNPVIRLDGLASRTIRWFAKTEWVEIRDV